MERVAPPIGGLRLKNTVTAIRGHGTCFDSVMGSSVLEVLGSEVAIQSDHAEQKRLRRDLRVLVRFILTYCNGQHRGADRSEVDLKSHNLREFWGQPVRLCSECGRLLAHAFVKRIHCPMHPKPACKHCPQHCYHPKYRAAIREVMKYSGRKLVLTGRMDYLLHLLF